ncbi:MAG: hypothetical protein IAF58_13670, partial [Leptolyngbya sp.]|nr:hypothetical protein [Candidatus Melainabacteria bacterium]
AQKIDEASIALISFIETSSEKDQLGPLKLLFETDTDVNRLTQYFEKWLTKSNEPAVRSFLVRSLGQLFLELRDFRSAAAVYDQGGPAGEFLIVSGRLHLLLGNADEARSRFAMVLGSSDKSLVEHAASGLSWIYWSQGDPKKAFEIVKNQTGAASLTLQCLIARSLGQTKDELAAIERLRTSYPRSVWLSLVDNHNDPAMQIDSLLLVLTGIGPAAGGTIRPVAPVSIAGAGSSQ